MSEFNYLDIVDYLLIAEATLGLRAEEVAHLADLSLAESALNAPRAEFAGVEFHPGLFRKAAVLCARLLWNHPLPDGNKRMAFMCTAEFLEHHGYLLAPEPEEAEKTICGVASHAMDEPALEEWLRGNCQPIE